MKSRTKIGLGITIFLLLFACYLFYSHFQLLNTAHDPQRCSAARADFLKYEAKYARTADYVGETQYCERLENEAWVCRYAAVAAILLAGFCTYWAFKPFGKVKPTGQ